MNMDEITAEYFEYTPFHAGALTEDAQSRERFYSTYEFLPEQVRELMVSLSVADHVRGIVEREGLRLAQGRAIARVIRDVLTGDLFIKEAAARLVQVANISELTAQRIMDDVVKNIFSLVVDEIRKTQREKFSDKLGAASQKPVVPSQPKSSDTIIDLRKLDE